ncbi:hypothetical protein Y032_0299g1792 [Ancylostoma ceylanicum]|nr:hypothetical protein Y032_0299g1792 [Ancylostoma ceylanicum]
MVILVARRSIIDISMILVVLTFAVDTVPPVERAGLTRIMLAMILASQNDVVNRTRHTLLIHLSSLTLLWSHCSHIERGRAIGGKLVHNRSDAQRLSYPSLCPPPPMTRCSTFLKAAYSTSIPLNSIALNALCIGTGRVAEFMVRPSRYEALVESPSQMDSERERKPFVFRAFSF